MLDLFTQPRIRSTVAELNIVPILDMLISVIFFLILTTSFLQFTKQSVPPSSIKKITDPVLPPPVAAKLIAVGSPDGLKIDLRWAGAEPGQTDRVYTSPKDGADPVIDRAGLMQAVSEMIEDFSKKYPNEKTLQIGLGADVPYQYLVTIMDAVKDKMPDMVLFSYAEAQVISEKMTPSDKPSK